MSTVRDLVFLSLRPVFYCEKNCAVNEFHFLWGMTFELTEDFVLLDCYL